MKKKKPIIGITGGIGAGKSTVAKEFAKLGCAVINADQINHELLEKKEVIDKIVSIWGGRVLREDGRIDHNRLSDIVFSDTAELRKLTDLMHPMIEERQNGLIETYLSDNKVVAIVLDVPLLYEVGWEKHCDCVVFVFCEDEVRHERIRQSRNWDVEKIKKIENFQLALDKKAEISEYTVVNKSSIPDLAKQVDILLALVLEEEK